MKWFGGKWVRMVGTLAVLGAAVSLGAQAPVAAAKGSTPVDQASTSTRGVTNTKINVVFPVVNLQALSAQLGFAGDVEYTEQGKAIQLFVNHINAAGGINGRKINPIITFFDPTSESNMRALCKDWTEGSPAAFAVLDGVGAWSGDNELCVTQEGHTPFLGQWTTISNWTQEGSPYLWWTGPDDAAILAALTQWGHSAGLLGGSRKVGVIAGDRSSDQIALNQYLLPDLKRIGVTPVIETIPSNPTETAQTDSDAPLVVEKLKAAGVNSIIPLLPFNAFLPVLSAQNSQHYYPRLLLSDYEESIESSLGLLPVPFEKELNGQEGVTTETLGGVDDDRPQPQGGYDAGVRSCWNIWHAAYPETPKGNMNDYIEEQGPIQGWCQEIDLFTKAATMAGKNLNRRTFVEAMSKITGDAGGYAPQLNFGPGKFYGPTEYQVVALHNNSPASAACKAPLAPLPAQGKCWVVKQSWKPLPKVS
ncbi:MAG TPA: ABC transporter substrate-binding protein [Acidimicrobiales bacterium]